MKERMLKRIVLDYHRDMVQSLYWYDLETFGKHPAWDKVAQFAGIRTNDQFEIIGEPLVLYCKITPDYIPDPVACLITGITPQETLHKGIPEYEFIKRIHEEFSVPGTCVAGYNSLNFDDEFIRNLYYRNFIDPYMREWANGNSRWDVLNLVRGVKDFRPEGMNWPKNEEGKNSFRLEHLTEANGISHENAHDALSDVRATIAIAKKIHETQPRFFEFYFKMRKKNNVLQYIDIHTKQPFYHTSAMFTSDQGCTTMVSPLAVDPVNKNCIICYDLRYDPTPLLELSADEIKKRVFISRENLPEGIERIPLKGVHINKCPLIAPLGTLTPVQSRKLGIDTELCLKHFEMLKKETLLTQKVTKVFTDNEYTEVSDPDFKIYSGGFFRDEDKAKFQVIHSTRKEDLPGLSLHFEDTRIPEMLWRFICRNYPEQFDKEERDKWKSFCASRTLCPPITDAWDFGKAEKKLKQLMENKTLNPGDKVVVKDLSEYIGVLKRKILSEG